MTTSKSMPNLTLSLCLIWVTERPYENKDRRSPSFSFKNRDFYLKLVLDTVKPFTYDLNMVTTTETKNFGTYFVKTYYRSKELAEDLFLQRKQTSSPADLISRVHVSEVEGKIPKYDGILTIVCVFDDPGNFTQLPYSERQAANYLPLNVPSLLRSSECPSLTTRDQFSSFESLSENLNSLLDNKILPDLQLMVGETSIPCHRAILAARSKVFAAMFKHEMTESNSGVLEIKDIDSSTIEVFLKYLYSGRIPDNLSEDILVKLFETGDKYEVTALKRVSSSKIMGYINKGNCLAYLKLSDTHSDQEFKDAIACYIIKDDALIKSSDWIQFSIENPMLALEVYRKYVEKEKN